MKLSKIAAAIASMTFLFGALSPARSQSSPPTAAPAAAHPLATKQNPAEAVRDLVSELIKGLKTPSGLPAPDVFTNRTAARVGYVYSDVMYIVLEDGMKGASRQQQGPIEAAGDRLWAIFQKYGVNQVSNKKGLESLSKNGRALYTDVYDFAQKPMPMVPVEADPDTGKNSKKMERAWMPKPGGFSTRIADYHFTPVSPTKVSITQTRHNGVSMNAVLEDGKWRLDFGNVVSSSNVWLRY
jgi:hypothetical protein